MEDIVTVGIGVLCEGYQNIVLAADCRGTYDNPHLGPHDEMGKQFVLPFGLYADIAGHFNHCESLIAFLTEEMEGLKTLPDVFLGHIRDAIRKAQAQELRLRFEAAFINNFGMTLDEFKKEITTASNPRFFSHGRALMRATQIYVELLVAGFTKDSVVLLSAAYKSPPEIVSSHESIGSGGLQALDQLNKRNQNPFYSCQRTILHVAEALEAAKVEPSVGQAADYIILQSNAVRRFKARDPIVTELVAKYRNKDSAELDQDMDAREKIKSLIYEQSEFRP
jgi:hypothetical protein